MTLPAGLPVSRTFSDLIGLLAPSLFPQSHPTHTTHCAQTVGYYKYLTKTLIVATTLVDLQILLNPFLFPNSTLSEYQPWCLPCSQGPYSKNVRSSKKKSLFHQTQGLPNVIFSAWSVPFSVLWLRVVPTGTSSQPILHSLEPKGLFTWSKYFVLPDTTEWAV